MAAQITPVASPPSLRIGTASWISGTGMVWPRVNSPTVKALVSSARKYGRPLAEMPGAGGTAEHRMRPSGAAVATFR
jgi:hypothetical protein